MFSSFILGGVNGDCISSRNSNDCWRSVDTIDLVFVVIELKNNATQARAANIASRDQQHSQFMRYWFEEENFALVQKGRKDYGALDDKEKQKFEYYIDERVRMFSFSLSTGQVSSTPQFHYRRIKEFFKYQGCIQCYEHLVSEKVIPTAWQRHIQEAMK